MYTNQDHVDALNHARHLARVANKLSWALQDRSRFTERQISEVVQLINQGQRDLNGVRSPIRKATETTIDWATDDVHTERLNLWTECFLGLALEMLALIFWLMR